MRNSSPLALARSISGWKRWIHPPMPNFSDVAAKAVEDNISKIRLTRIFTAPFLVQSSGRAGLQATPAANADQQARQDRHQGHDKGAGDAGDVALAARTAHRIELIIGHHRAPDGDRSKHTRRRMADV